jgi:SpoVK/Ycf46/Vps4 family AAA+-type ATPase
MVADGMTEVLPPCFTLVLDLPEPGRDTRLASLKVHCRESPLGNDVNLGALADATEGMNGADLAALRQRAKMLAIEASVDASPARISSPSPSAQGTSRPL